MSNPSDQPPDFVAMRFRTGKRRRCRGCHCLINATAVDAATGLCESCQVQPDLFVPVANRPERLEES